MAESTTDNGTDQSSSDSREEPLLENNQQGQSADEQQDTGSSDSQSQDSGQSDDAGRSQDDSTTQTTDGSDDESLAKFAKAQGFDPDNLTDGERKALKIARDNQKAFHEKSQEHSDELRKATEDIHQVDPEFADDQEQLLTRIARTESLVKVNEFYQSNPDARQYDTEMGTILKEEAERNGTDAARYLGSDLRRLYILAKDRKGVNDAEMARETGRREERESLRKKQEGSADAGQAQSSQQQTTKINAEWVENEYDPSNAEHRQLVDEAIARGDLY